SVSTTQTEDFDAGAPRHASAEAEQADVQSFLFVLTSHPPVVVAPTLPSGSCARCSQRMREKSSVTSSRNPSLEAPVFSASNDSGYCAPVPARCAKLVSSTSSSVTL